MRARVCVCVRMCLCACEGVWKRVWNVQRNTPLCVLTVLVVVVVGLALFLACTFLVSQADWELVYCTARDGMSFNRLVHGIMGYNGPTLFVIKTEAGEVFGAFAGFVIALSAADSQRGLVAACEREHCR
jgi:hypothetical protein